MQRSHVEFMGLSFYSILQRETSQQNSQKNTCVNYRPKSCALLVPIRYAVMVVFIKIKRGRSTLPHRNE